MPFGVQKASIYRGFPHLIGANQVLIIILWKIKIDLYLMMKVNLSKTEFKEFDSNQKDNSNHPIFSLIQNTYKNLLTNIITENQALPSHISWEQLSCLDDNYQN